MNEWRRAALLTSVAALVMNHIGLVFPAQAGNVFAEAQYEAAKQRSKSNLVQAEAAKHQAEIEMETAKHQSEQAMVAAKHQAELEMETAKHRSELEMEMAKHRLQFGSN